MKLKYASGLAVVCIGLSVGVATSATAGEPVKTIPITPENSIIATVEEMQAAGVSDPAVLQGQQRMIDGLSPSQEKKDAQKREKEFADDPANISQPLLPAPPASARIGTTGCNASAYKIRYSLSGQNWTTYCGIGTSPNYGRPVWESARGIVPGMWVGRTLYQELGAKYMYWSPTRGPGTTYYEFTTINRIDVWQVQITRSGGLP